MTQIFHKFSFLCYVTWMVINQLTVITAGNMMSRHGQWTLYLNSPRGFGTATSNTSFMSMQERTTVRTMSTLLAGWRTMGTGA